MTTPFNKPFVAGRELQYIAQAVKDGNIAGDGRFTQLCSKILEERFAIPRVLLTSSCTAALEMAAMLCELGPGDEVILPSYTFVSTASAVARAGATPVFVDIRRDTLNIDEQRIEEAITPRTRAIMPVHYAGVGCEMDRILGIAAAHGLRIIEDAAHGVTASYKGRALGSLGDLGTYSFHETKNYISGQGGALCINDPALVERAEIIRDKGTDRQRFARGEVDKYTWVDLGSSYVPSEIVSAFLYGQLEMLDSITERRRLIYNRYREGLAPLEEEGLCRLPRIPEGCESNFHMFYLVLRDRKARDALIAHLNVHGIHAVFHYVPLHSSPMGRRLGQTRGELPVTDEISARLLRLPFFYGIGETEQQEVAKQVADFLHSAPGQVR